ncbi:hypothetical protein B0T10DRAFT_596796 [Thelonectria olida]|uniref:BTB domain transcription factor n=1 Tax=Thelonectria olida TaxID=1576542 RepID=A0A9P8W9A2_9HYPO|nr:hypothetical protein B0T10DRAFT_596796 [Thelonectria olida]
MAGSQSSSSDEKGKDTAATGEKHQIEHESPDKKRPKTENEETDEKEKVDKEDTKEQSKGEAKAKQNQDKDDAVEPSKEPDMPSNTMEKGLVYFFIRGRVNINEPESVTDIARSFMLLRPLPKDARLGKGPIADAGNTRVIALPKKVFPTSPKDRFMAFVNMTDASYEKVKDDFLASTDYVTKTAGSRHTPQATPIAEGVYAMTSTGRESHFAYMLTLPEKLDEVQKELGLKKQGSFIVSTKNPKYPGPANARLPKGPEFSDEILEDFRNLRWVPSKPIHFDFVNAQVLLIGEPSIEKATEAQDKEQEKGKDSKEALEELEEDDLERMQHLGESDSESIFADLHVRAKDYPELQTTF